MIHLRSAAAASGAQVPPQRPGTQGAGSLAGGCDYHSPLGVTSTHPSFDTYLQAAKQRLEVLQGNPGWSQERKVVFAKRLIKRLASTTA